MSPPNDRRPIELRLLGLGHRLVHRLSGGRFGRLEPGAQAPRGRVLSVITLGHSRLDTWPTGRKSGRPRTVPLPYFPHPQGYVVVASYAGGPRNPAWYDNLVAQPEVELQIRGRRVRAIAAAASPSERPEIWSRLLSSAPMYEDYQRITSREIPLVVLREVKA